MGSADRMRVAAGIITEQQNQRPVAVVVSAMSRVTDLLLETLRRAELGDRAAVDSNVRSLLARHLETCDELLGGSKAAPKHCEAAREDVQSLVAEFHRIAN